MEGIGKEGRCNFWLAKKKRFCANSPLSNSLFCGNHKPGSEEVRVPCPIDPSQQLPFQEKHVLQQASILGNLEAFGIIGNSNDFDDQEADEHLRCDDSSRGKIETPAVIEFGAGRGYLTQMLADCYGIQKVFLVERRSYKLKADRSLRQKQHMILERLRIDIEDLNLDAIESLRGVSYLAIGKHLCGPATDLTLRCCLPKQCSEDGVLSSSNCNLKGLALATCCHHLSQWKHYINKRFFSDLGISKEDFHAITWFTSWAVDADHGSILSDVVNHGLHKHNMDPSLSCENRDSDVSVTGVEEIVRNMKSVDRAVLGMICKEIIDIGRLMWVKEHGLQAQLVKYVPSNISPENHLLVAKETNSI